MKIHFLIVLFALLGWNGGQALAQTEGNHAYAGREFWFGFMDNTLAAGNDPNVPNYWVTVCVPPALTDDMVQVVLEAPGLSLTDTFYIPRGGCHVVVFPTSDRDGSGKPAGLPVNNTGIDKLYPLGAANYLRNIPQGRAAANALYVRSTSPVMVTAYNQRPFTTDAAQIMPASVLSDEYLVADYMEWNANDMGQCLIVAGPCGASVDVTAPRSLTLRSGQTLERETPLRLNLKPGETYLLQLAADFQASLTGLRVRSSVPNEYDRRFAVFTGNRCGIVGECSSCDHLYAQQPPLSHAGGAFALVGSQFRRKYQYRVVAAQDRTTVRVYTMVDGELEVETHALSQAGSYKDLELGALFGSGSGRAQAPRIVADQPVFVAEMSQGLSCDSNNWETGFGDPSFWLLPSFDHMTTDKTAFALLNMPPSRAGSRPWIHVLNIVCDSALVEHLRIDGSDTFAYTQTLPIASYFQPVAGDSSRLYASLVYDVRNFTDWSRARSVEFEFPNGFTPAAGQGYNATLHGMANFDSYGTTIAASGSRTEALPCSTVSRRSQAPADFGAKVHPNPATDRVELRWQPSTGLGSFTVFDLSGRELLSARLDGTGRQSIETSALRPGLYLLRLEGEGGQQSLRLIIE